MGVTAINTAHIYMPEEDGWAYAPNAASAGVFGAGACGFISPIGTSATATAGTTSTLTTNLTINHNLRGYKIRITAGPSAAGQELTIVSNTLGANSVITVAAQGAAFTTATTYTLLTPRLWYFCPGTAAIGFNVFDWALNTWTARSVANLPTAFGTDGKLVGTPGIKGGSFDTSTGKTTATSASTTLVTSAGANWTVGNWANCQVRLTGGTGAGQIRVIASNTANTLTTTGAWTTIPDATTTWVIEGNDDNIYLFGNNSVILYKYSITANTWATVTPGAARAGGAGAGMSGDWVSSCADPVWSNPNACLNGRYIYSFRGAGQTVLDLYDIAANTWISGKAYGQQAESFNTGSVYEYDGDYIYALKSGGQNLYRFSLPLNRLDPLTTLPYPQSTAVVGDKLFLSTYIDGAAKIKFLYNVRQSGAELLRIMLY